MRRAAVLQLVIVDVAEQQYHIERDALDYWLKEVRKGTGCEGHDRRLQPCRLTAVLLQIDGNGALRMLCERHQVNGRPTWWP